MAPAPAEIKSILKTPKPVRNVTFQSTCEVRYFGKCEVETVNEKKPRILDFSKYISYSIDDNDDIDFNKRIIGEPSGLNADPTADSSLLVHDGNSPPWTISAIFKPAKSLNTPLRKASIQLMKRNRAKALAIQKAENQSRQLKECNGVVWNTPKALKHVRQDWRFNDEMESAGEDPADNEMDGTFSECRQKKKLLTKKERISRHVDLLIANEKKQNEMNVQNFIQKIKNGEVCLSIASIDVSKSSEKFKSFGKSLEKVLANEKKDQKVLNFLANAFITRRLMNKDLDSRLRSVYETIAAHYEIEMSIYLVHLSKQKKNSSFSALERMFLLGV